VASKLEPTPPAAPAPRDYNELPKGTFRDEWNEAEILARAAQIIAERDAPSAEPEPVPSVHIPEGGSTLVHVLGDAVTVDRVKWYERGSEFLVTAEEAARLFDRKRNNYFDEWIESGRVGLGPYPSHRRPWVFGTLGWERARAEAVQKAARLDSADALRAERERIEQYFGPERFSPQTAEAYYHARTAEAVAQAVAEASSTGTKR
jgi:hypothetical protein